VRWENQRDEVALRGNRLGGLTACAAADLVVVVSPGNIYDRFGYVWVRRQANLVVMVSHLHITLPAAGP